MRSPLAALTALRRHRWLALGLTLGLVLALGGGLAVYLPGRAHAATTVVTTCTESALDAAVAAANPGDTIQFGCSGTITLTSTLNITKDVTLEGSGQSVTLDGNHQVRVLSVTSANFILDHLTVANGFATGTELSYGAGLAYLGGSTDQTLTLSNCAFMGNTALATGSTREDGQGGAISFSGGALHVDNCSFTHNTAQGSDTASTSSNSGVGGRSGPGNGPGDGVGGAIFFQGYTATLTNCTFMGNTVQGGAGSASTNGGQGIGGAVYGAGNPATLTLTNCSFTGNTALGGPGGNAGTSAGGGNGGDARGGGLYTDLGALAIDALTNCSLSNNIAQGGAGSPDTTATQGGGGGQAYGGAIYDGSGQITLTDSTLSHNGALGGAGAAGANSSSGSGGYGGSGGSAYGGGMYDLTSQANTPVTFSASTITNNRARGGPGGAGGSSTSSSWTGGGAGFGGWAVGGGLYIESSGSPTVTLSNSILSDNTASAGDGAGGGDPSGNGGGGGLAEGGGFFDHEGTVLISGSTVNSNAARSGSGGAGGSFGGNGGSGGTSRGGGGVYMSDGKVHLSFTDSTLSNNVAQGGNGAGGGNGGSGGSGGNSNGGGLYSSRVFTDLMFTDSTIAENSARGGIGGDGTGSTGNGGNGGNSLGGGLYSLSNGATTLTNATWAGNAAEGGGAGQGAKNGNGGVSEGQSVFAAFEETLYATSSILSSSAADTCAGIDTGSQIVDKGYNLDSGTSCGFSTAHHSLSNTDPRLAALGNYGGPTQTMALLPGSPAINAGGSSANGCLATDQRGVSRPQGPACDIGAYEFVPTTTTTLTASPNPALYQQAVQLCATVHPASGTPGPATGTVSFREGGTTLGSGQLGSSGSACFSTSALSVGDHQVTASYGGDASFTASTSSRLTVSIQVEGQDVAGTASGNGGSNNTSSSSGSSASQTQADAGQNGSSASAAGGQAPRQRAASHSSSGSTVSGWLETGLGGLLALLGLAGLGVIFMRTWRRRSTPEMPGR